MSDTATPRPSLAAKLHQVMESIPYIQKDRENTFHKYAYASEAAIKRHVQTALVKAGVVFTCSSSVVSATPLLDKDGKPTKELLTTVRLDYAFRDRDSNETIEGSGIGTGADSGDKGVYKAITGGLKYIFASTFLFETGDDPEVSEEAPPPPPKAVTKASPPPRPSPLPPPVDKKTVPPLPVDDLAKDMPRPEGLGTEAEVKAWKAGVKKYAAENGISTDQIRKYLTHYLKHGPAKQAFMTKFEDVPLAILTQTASTLLTASAVETIKSWQPPVEGK